MKLKIRQLISKKQTILLISSALLFFLAYFVKQMAQINIDATTNFYTFGFYKYYITFLSKINSLVPFSIAEVLVVLFGIFVVFYVILLVKTLIFNREKLVSTLILLIFPASIIYFMFSISYIPNYYNYNFVHYSELETTETTVDNLYLLCVELAENATAYREILEQENQVFSYSNELSHNELFEICTDSYNDFTSDYPEFTSLFDVVQNATAKPVILSEIMSYLKINGFFFGLTGEANVNTHTSAVYIPSTVCHELAHVAGFMREDEANFISFLVCRSSDNEYLNYSGTMLALLYSGNALYSKSPEKYFEVMSLLSTEVIMDINAHSEYYNAHDTNIGKVSTSVNDTYLRANDQADGVNSYGRMVDLLIADYNARH
ncbi:MAG: DUF3810 domain-containing protein [Clostridia bacterium]